MNSEEIRTWAEAYVRAEMVHGLNTDHPDWWAVKKFMYVGMEDAAAQDYLSAILAILDLKPDEKVIDALATGPVEDLLEDCGDEVIDDIERLARQRPDFKHLLAGTWESGTPEVWSRILACRGETQ